MATTTSSQDGTVIAFDRAGAGPPLILVDPRRASAGSVPWERTPSSSPHGSRCSPTTAAAAARAPTRPRTPSTGNSKTSRR
jgi:hypothetical protein